MDTATSTKHTRGPWVVSEQDATAIYREGGAGLIAAAYGNPVHRHADASLIAAAPDGLEAARFALSVLRANPIEQSERMAIEKLSAFITKATGEQP